MIIDNFGIALPEIITAVACVAALLIGSLMTGKASAEKQVAVTGFIVVAAMISSIVFMIFFMPEGQRIVGYSGFYVYDDFSRFIKIMIAAFTVVCIYISRDYFENAECNRFEIPILFGLASTGGMILISANDFLPLYLGLELQSISLYTLCAVRRDESAPTEAGLKYFILGSLASGFLLYGISLLYGYAGSTNFESLAQTFSAVNMSAAAELTGTHIAVIPALVFIFAGAAFKLSAAPFHMWTPDVYQGAPTPVSAYLSSVSKITAFALLLRIMADPLSGLIADYNQIIIALAVVSAVVGSFAGLVQIDLKRLLGYSAIGNIGFAVMALAGGLSENSLKAALFYMIVYAVTAVGLFAVVLTMKQKEKHVTEISDLQGISSSHPGLALCTAILLFSAAGIPPLAGFLSKLFVFQTVVERGYYVLAVIGGIASVVSAYYYLRIVRVMYMDEPLLPFDKPLPRRPYKVALAAAFAVAFLVFVPEPLLDFITGIAQMLIRG